MMVRILFLVLSILSCCALAHYSDGAYNGSDYGDYGTDNHGSGDYSSDYSGSDNYGSGDYSDDYSDSDNHGSGDYSNDYSGTDNHGSGDYSDDYSGGDYSDDYSGSGNNSGDYSGDYSNDYYGSGNNSGDYSGSGDYSNDYSGSGHHDTTTSNHADNNTSTTSGPVVTCDSTNLQFCSSETITCQQLLHQGTCQDGEWLVATGSNWQHGDASCTPRVCTTTGEYYYPTNQTCVHPLELTCGDNKVPALTLSGTIDCHCKSGTVPFQDGGCYEPYSKGPCKGRNYLVVTPKNGAKCRRYQCVAGTNWVKFRNVCYQLDKRGPCSKDETLQASPATSFRPQCLTKAVAKAVTSTPTVCSDGMYADGNGNCKAGVKIYYIDFYRSEVSVKEGRCEAETTTNGTTSRPRRPSTGGPNSGRPNAGGPNSGRPNAGGPNSGRPNPGRPNSGRGNPGRPNSG